MKCAQYLSIFANLQVPILTTPNICIFKCAFLFPQEHVTTPLEPSTSLDTGVPSHPLAGSSQQVILGFTTSNMNFPDIYYFIPESHFASLIVASFLSFQEPDVLTTPEGTAGPQPTQPTTSELEAPDSPDVAAELTPIPFQIDIDTLTPDDIIFIGQGMTIYVGQTGNRSALAWGGSEFGGIICHSSSSFSIPDRAVLNMADWRDMLRNCSREPINLPKPQEKLRHIFAIATDQIGPSTFAKSQVSYGFDSSKNKVLLKSALPPKATTALQKASETFRKSWKNPEDNPFANKPKNRVPRQRVSFSSYNSEISDMLEEDMFRLSQLPVDKRKDLAPLLNLLMDPKGPNTDPQAPSKEAKDELKARQALGSQTDILEYLEITRRLTRTLFNSDKMDAWFNLGFSFFEDRTIVAAEEFFRHRILLRQKAAANISDAPCRAQLLSSDLLSKHLVPIAEAASIEATLQARITNRTVTKTIRSYEPPTSNIQRTKTKPKNPGTTSASSQPPFRPSKSPGKPGKPGKTFYTPKPGKSTFGGKPKPSTFSPSSKSNKRSPSKSPPKGRSPSGPPRKSPPKQ